MLQVTVIIAIIYVLMIIYDFYEAEKHWEEIQEDSKEEK
jgi:hypothetical protein